MTGLRSNWNAEQVRANLSQASNDLPEAITTHRFPLEGTASGIDFMAGEETYDDSGAQGLSSVEGLPADPPQRPEGLGD